MAVSQEWAVLQEYLQEVGMVCCLALSRQGQMSHPHTILTVFLLIIIITVILFGLKAAVFLYVCSLKKAR